MTSTQKVLAKIGITIVDVLAIGAALSLIACILKELLKWGISIPSGAQLTFGAAFCGFVWMVLAILCMFATLGVVAAGIILGALVWEKVDGEKKS